MRFKIGSTYTLGYGIGKVRIESPTATDKTFKAVRLSDGKSLHFGDPDMPTRQDNPKAKSSYCARAKGISSKRGFNPNTFSLIYWDCIAANTQGNKMQQNVLIYTNVGKAQITDTDSHFKITGIPITKNDSIMNRVLYPADENQRGMPTMKEKPITLRHPEVDGVNVSAAQGRGLNYFSGSLVESEPYIENNTWKIDALINKKKLAAQDDGQRWTEILSNKEVFGVSTGLIFERNAESGDGYDMVARNQQYDHLAFLDPKVERPAGGDNTMVRFNASVEAGEIIVHNIELDDDPQINNEHKSLFNKFLSWLGSHGEFADVNQTGYNNDDSKTNRGNTMLTRDETIELLANAGITIAANASDDDVKAALNEYMSKPKKTEMDDDDEDKMSKSNGAEMTQLIEQIVNKAVEPLKAQINANAEAELNKVAEQVKALNIGLDADDAKALGLDKAKAFLAANSQTSAVGFPGAVRSSVANRTLLDTDMPE